MDIYSNENADSHHNQNKKFLTILNLIIMGKSSTTSKNVGTKNVGTKNVGTKNVETKNVETLDVSGLESATTAKSNVAQTNENQFTDLEFLTNSNPSDFHTNENVSSKFDKEREDKVQEGIELVKVIQLANKSVVNPLLVLLAKWWEVKPARAGIKKLIDAEALAKGFESDVYLQIELKKEINELAELSSAIERMKYSTTYFKPRKPLSNKVPMQNFKIANKMYTAPIATMLALKEEFGHDKELLRAEVIKIAIELEDEIEEL